MVGFPSSTDRPALEAIQFYGLSLVFVPLDRGFPHSTTTTNPTNHMPDHTNLVGRGGHSLPVQTGITADATAPPTQDTAIANAPLIAGYNEVAVSASDDDAVALPPAKAGLVVIIENADAAQDIEVWPNTGDSINGGTVNAKDATALGQGAQRIYVAKNDTDWRTIL